MDNSGFVPRAPGKGNITAIRPKTWNAIADVVNGGRVGANGPSAPAGADGMGSGWVWVKNNSGSDRSRFDCMALGDPTMALTTNGQVDVVFAATTADRVKTPAILLEPIADGRVGRAVIYGLCLAKVAAGTTTLRAAEPQASSHDLKPVASGPIKLLTAPSASVVTLAPVVITPASSAFYIYVLTADMGTNSTTAAIYNFEVPFTGTSGLVASGATLHNTLLLASHQVSGAKGVCIPYGSNYAVLIPECEPEEDTSGGSGGP